MKKWRKGTVLFAAGCLLDLCAHAQTMEDKIRTKGFPEMPVITNAAIPGAPLLGQPFLLTGTQQDIRTEKHGLAYPLMYDWNRDGKWDLLLGEFETGGTGSDVKVFLNEGTAKKPKFSGRYSYAEDTKGDTITAYQWCCIGTHPRLADLNNDGVMDLLSGQYNPGQINWWPGTTDGFGPRRFVEQEAYVEGAKLDVFNQNQLDPASLLYWNYTSAGFADVNGDGLVDLLVGGAGIAELRVALNVGTADKPKFGMRTYLLGVNGLPLSVVKPSEEDVKNAAKSFRFPHYAGVQKSFMTPVDWDGDGVLDLLVTHMYGDRKTKDPVVFFRGVQTDKGLRFLDAVPLFTAKQVEKTFPGCQPNITVGDYNNDGVMDLIIGVSLPTLNGFEIDSLVAWSYLHEIGIESPGKDAGRMVQYEGGIEKLKLKLEKEPGYRKYYLGKLDDYKYLTIRHRGYVYVMLGKRNPVSATALKGIKAADEVRLVNQTIKSNKASGPVSFRVNAPGAVSLNDTGRIEVRLTFQDGWYGYAPTPANEAAGWIPTRVEIEWPEGFLPVGEPVSPKPVPKAGAEVYVGKELLFGAPFKFTAYNKEGKLVRSGDQKVRVLLHYQTCNEEQCLPPETEEMEMTIFFRF